MCSINSYIYGYLVLMWIVMRFRVTHLFSDLEYQEKLTCWPSWSIFVVSGCIFDTKWPVHKHLIYKSVNMEWRRPWIIWFFMISIITGVLKNPSFIPLKPFGWRTPGDRFWYSIFSSWPMNGCELDGTCNESSFRISRNYQLVYAFH